MTTRIFLVRHGQTESNITGFYMGWSDEDLNSTGIAQAQSLSKRLASHPVATVYTSPLRRAVTTASLVGAPHGLEPLVLDDLIEINLGEWQGLHLSEISRGWHELWRQWRTDPTETVLPGGESFRQVAERVRRAFDKIVADERNRQTVLVSHEIVVKLIVAHVLGAPYSVYRRFEVANASLSEVRITDGRMKLITLNDTAHLGD